MVTVVVVGTAVVVVSVVVVGATVVVVSVVVVGATVVVWVVVASVVVGSSVGRSTVDIGVPTTWKRQQTQQWWNQ